MGAVWLISLPDVLAAAGLDVDTWEGWEARARSTGGYDDVRAVQVHHTASSTSPHSDMQYMWNGSPDRPVGAIYLARDGRLTVGAAGATNTSGKGGPLATSRGPIPADAANKYVISIEAANDGVGELWPDAQLDAYVAAVAALNDAYGLDVGDVHAHFEWTTRKIDPAGQSAYATGSASWDMHAFRDDVRMYDPAPIPIPPPPTGEVDDMLHVIVKDPNTGAVLGGPAIIAPGYWHASRNADEAFVWQKMWGPPRELDNLYDMNTLIKGVALSPDDDDWVGPGAY